MKDKSQTERDRLLSYQGPIVVDTGLYVEFLGKTKLGEFVKINTIDNELLTPILLHDLILTELYYVTSTQLGIKKADEVLAVVKKIGTIIPGDFLVESAGQIKCERAISLSDCFTLAIGKLNQIPVLFKEEKELTKELSKADFDFPLYLL